MQLNISINQQSTGRENRWVELLGGQMTGFQYPGFESAAMPCLIGGVSDVLDTLNRKQDIEITEFRQKKKAHHQLTLITGLKEKQRIGKNQSPATARHNIGVDSESVKEGGLNPH